MCVHEIKVWGQAALVHWYILLLELLEKYVVTFWETMLNLRGKFNFDAYWSCTPHILHLKQH
jgi:hypothetical protein